MPTYNRQQWIDSFEGQLLILRPHLGERLLATLSNAAWHKHGTKDEDPIKAAKAWSASLDKLKK
jgi:hypothetical protein